MSTDRRTLDFYDGAARDYAAQVEVGGAEADLRAFIGALPAGGRVLDLGCGPGDAAARMRDAGLAAEAMDASPAMVALARERHGLEVRLAEFSELDASGRYDGIWASFSLLHAPLSELGGHLDRVAAALKPVGVFHWSMKEGSGERRDRLGRFYCYLTEREMREMLAARGLALLQLRRGTARGMAAKDEPFISTLSVLRDG